MKTLRQIPKTYQLPLMYSGRWHDKTLSKREKEIVAMLSNGWTEKEIADELCISPLTVKTHHANIHEKLPEVKNLADLVRYWYIIDKSN